MNNLHDARAWELVRRLATNNSGETIVYTNLRAEARELLAQASELEEAKRMIAHLQSIRLGLLEALEACKSAAQDASRPPSARLELVRDYSTPALNAAQAGKIPPAQVQTVKILGETPIQWRDLP